jgi:shikimate kinase
MTNIVWIYGSSASGKATFINRLLNNLSQDLIDRLGWKNKKIICVEESIKYVGQFNNDPVLKKRIQIINKVKNLSNKSNLVILIKGQDVDLKSNLPNILQEELPNAKHQIIFLHADLQILYERCRKKTWWTKEDEEAGIEDFKEWLSKQLRRLKQLKNFKITTLDSSDYEYRQIKFPPEIK